MRAEHRECEMCHAHESSEYRGFINTNLHTTMRYRTKMSPQNQSVSVVEAQRHVIDPANFYRALDDGVEDRLDVRR